MMMHKQFHQRFIVLDDCLCLSHVLVENNGLSKIYAIQHATAMVSILNATLSRLLLAAHVIVSASLYCALRCVCQLIAALISMC